MIDMLLNWIVKLIMGLVNKALYLTKVKEQRKKVKDAKANAKQAKEESDSAAGDFRVRLQQYRKSRDINLRRSVKRVRDGRGKAGADNSQAGRNNSGAGQADQD